MEWKDIEDFELPFLYHFSKSATRVLNVAYGLFKTHCNILAADRNSSDSASCVICKMKVEDILFVIFAIVAVSLVAWYLFGQSPTIEQALLVLVIGLTIKNHGDIRELKGRLCRP